MTALLKGNGHDVPEVDVRRLPMMSL